MIAQRILAIVAIHDTMTQETENTVISCGFITWKLGFSAINMSIPTVFSHGDPGEAAVKKALKETWRNQLMKGRM